jgi:hypothetical protein
MGASRDPDRLAGSSVGIAWARLGAQRTGGARGGHTEPARVKRSRRGLKRGVAAKPPEAKVVPVRLPDELLARVEVIRMLIERGLAAL